MDPNTGRLSMVSEEEANAMKDLDSASDDLKRDLEGLEPLPADLQEAAKRKLEGQKETYVSLKSGGKLSRWASSKRKQAKEKNKRKMAKQSRKNNRGTKGRSKC